MSNYKHAKDLEGQVLTLIEAIVPEVARAEAAKSIFRRLFHEWVDGLDVGMTGVAGVAESTAVNCAKTVKTALFGMCTNPQHPEHCSKCLECGSHTSSEKQHHSACSIK